MASFNEIAYQSTANLNLWLKIQSGDDLTLADIPAIIPLRWNYFRDNWNFIRKEVLNRADKSNNPDFLRATIDEFTKFIEKQRYQKINPFSDLDVFYRFYEVFDNVFIDSINLTNDETDIVDNTVTKIKAYSKNNFLEIKKNIIKYRDTLADIHGVADADYNKAVDRSSVPQQAKISINELNIMAQLQNSLNTVDFIVANLFAVDTAIDPFALARVNANNPEINIGQYASGTLAKLEYGEDLQGLAYRYFGDANKWIDIAIANGLKPPYIDEVGEKISLIANGSGNLINIAQNDINGKQNIAKLFINQAVTLQSNTLPFPNQRIIKNIRQVPVSGEIIIELDGDSNLSTYQIIDSASIRIFLPNTTNSSFFILIPSTQPLDNPRKDDVPWFLAKSQEDEKMAKVDIAMSSNGDINFGTNGDISLSYGLANHIQAIKIKMMTELGSLRYHPDFGLVNVLGFKNSEVDAIKNALITSIQNQIRADSRFSRLENIDVQYGVGPEGNNAVGAITMTLSVRIAGGDTVIPISFTVNK